MDRYARQIVLPEVGHSGQEALQNAKVLVIGCGGLAAPVCTYLAAAGVGKLGLVDHDKVDVSNLQRQTLFDDGAVGELKVEAAQKQLQKIAPNLVVEAFPETFNSENSLAISSGFDCLIDCTDNFSAKYLINDVALLQGLPLIFGTVTGFDGQFGIFNGRDGSCFRCLYPEPPKAIIQNCQESGVLGAVVGVVGAWQAMECLKVILHRGGVGALAPAYGRISVLDLRNSTQTNFSVPKRKGCLCEPGRSIPLMPIVPLLCQMGENSISWAEARARKDVGFLDVREAGEINQGMIPEAKHWALSRLENGEFPNFLENRSVWVIYCARGLRSKRAAELISAKFAGVAFLSLAGGFLESRNP